MSQWDIINFLDNNVGWFSVKELALELGNSESSVSIRTCKLRRFGLVNWFECKHHKYLYSSKKHNLLEPSF